MKSIIWDISEMTDSTEVYESRPAPFLIGTIYLILTILGVMFLWMYIFKIDVVVKGNGLFKGVESGINVSAGISGNIKACNVADGQYVKAGQRLLTLEADSLDNTRRSCEQELEDTEQRIAILRAYMKSLNGSHKVLNTMKRNPYYTEFLNRKQLLDASIAAADENVEGQMSLYQSRKNSIGKSLANQLKKLNKLKRTIIAVKKRENPFKKRDTYYHSIVNSYISNYNNTSLQYNNQILEFRNNIVLLKRQKKHILLNDESGANKADSDSKQDISTRKTLEQQIRQYKNNLIVKKTEKKKELNSLELQQISSLKQEIMTVQSSIQSLKENMAELEMQIETLKGKDTESSDNISIMTEKENVATELLTCKNEKQENLNNLNNLKIQDKNCQIQASDSGYVIMTSEVREGMYIQQGAEICRILPEQNSNYYAEVYIDNENISRLEEGQEVKFEIAAYPSSEYDDFTGVLSSISKDVRIDQNTGSTYYVLKVLCKKMTLKNKKGEIGYIRNGMACQAKVIVREQSVWDYVLEKLF